MIYLLLVVVAVLIVYRSLRFETSSDRIQPVDPNIEYRKKEKEKAIAAMSSIQKQKAAALNEGEVADLEIDGNLQVIIMEKTARVYEWDGFDWVDRWPNFRGL